MRVSYRFTPMPIELPVAWLRVSFYARLVGQDLFRMIGGGEVEWPTEDWKAVAVSRMAIHGRERREAMKALDRLHSAGLIEVGEGSIRVLLAPAPTSRTTGVRPRGLGAADPTPTAHQPQVNRNPTATQPDINRTPTASQPQPKTDLSAGNHSLQPLKIRSDQIRSEEIRSERSEEREKRAGALPPESGQARELLESLQRSASAAQASEPSPGHTQCFRDAFAAQAFELGWSPAPTLTHNHLRQAVARAAEYARAKQLPFEQAAIALARSGLEGARATGKGVGFALLECEPGKPLGAPARLPPKEHIAQLRKQASEAVDRKDLTGARVLLAQANEIEDREDQRRRYGR